MNANRTLLLLVLLCSVCTSATAQVADTRELPSDYVSDRCSMFPDGDWGECCVQHDKAYFFGGSEKARRTADKELFQCVRAKGGLNHRFISDVMWLGVRLGGVAFVPSSFRWGFGKDWRSDATGQ